VKFKLVLGTGVVIVHFCNSGTDETNKFVASFVNCETAHLALKSLSAKPPYKVLAMATERGLFEESRDEFVIFDFKDVLLSESAATIEAAEFLLSFISGGKRRR